MPYTGQKIPTCYAKQLVRNYKELKLGKQLLPDDSRAVWFSKDVILEALRLPPDTDTNGVTGLRIYFGSYANHPKFPRDPTYRRMMTLVIVQTQYGEDNGLAVHRDILESPNDTAHYPDDLREYNDGQICPPPGCDDTGLLFPDN